jgi:hypothetical protein
MAQEKRGSRLIAENKRKMERAATEKAAQARSNPDSGAEMVLSDIATAYNKRAKDTQIKKTGDKVYEMQKKAKGGSVKKMAAGGSFSEAFRAARKGGEKTFTWNGKSYTTKLKEEVAAPKRAAPARPASRPPTGMDNKKAYDKMMAESDAVRSKESQKTSAGRAVDFLAKGDPKTRGLPAGKRFSVAFRESMKSDTPKPKPKPKPPEEKKYDKRGREISLANRNIFADEHNKQGQALKRGGKVKKKYV